MVKYCSFSHPPLLNNRALIDIIYIGVNNRLIMAGQKIEDRIMDTFTLGEDYVKTLRMNYPWVERAVSSGLTTKKNQSVFTMTVNIDGQEMLIPKVRRKRVNGKPIDELEELSDDDAIKMALKNRDFIPVPSTQAGELLSKAFSRYQGKKK